MRAQTMSLPPIMPTYGRQPVTFSHGVGSRLYDTDGREYLDAISGLGVNALGHAHPAVTEAIQLQSQKLIHTSNLYGIEAQQQLAELLCQVTGMESIFFSNSGAEANEAAIKLARLYGHGRGIEVPTIIVMEKAFHGRTMATLTATGNRKIQRGFEPLLSGFVRAPFGDLQALENIASNNRNIAAVLLEPIQGEGGVNVLPDGFLAEVRALCDRNDWLLMLDEVQTGNGRTGRYFAYQHSGILPDVVTTAKGLANGVPIGACLAQGKAAGVFGPGNHGSTYGGNPLACATAHTVVTTIQQQNLCANAEQMGQFLQHSFRTRLQDSALVTDIRGQGLMIGIELDRPCAELVGQARERGLLINVTAERVIRLLPPLIITQAEAEQIVSIVVELIGNLNHS